MAEKESKDSVKRAISEALNMNKTLKELIQAVKDADGVKSVTYDSDKEKWLITYRYDANPDWMDTEVLMDFLENG